MSNSQVDLSGATILAVDDTPANLDVLLPTLEAEGYEVFVAVTGESALEIALRTPPGLILLDVMMPGIDGYETCRRLRAQAALAAIPVLFLTARTDVQGIIEGFAAGGNDYVTKPFNQMEVLSRIRTHLERAKFAAELVALNEHLESLVVERSRQLELKARELEGLDRITQRLLSSHRLEDILELILQVLGDTMPLGRAAVYLRQEDGLQAEAALGFDGSGMLVQRDRLVQLSLNAEHHRALEEVAKANRATHVVTPGDGAPAFAVVPVLKGETQLGLLWVEKPVGQGGVNDEELQILDSFALQATVAINDARIRQDPTEWGDELDEVIEINEEELDFFDSGDPAQR